jgi:propionate CoA-transferase
MREVSVLSADEAAQMIPGGATMAVGASSGISMRALGARFVKMGAPSDLTVIFPINVDDMYGQPGFGHLAHKGMTHRLVGGSFVSGPSREQTPALRDLIADNRVLCYNYPIGHLLSVLSDCAAKGFGYLTQTRLGTFIDPRCGGGGMNDRSRTQSWVRLSQLNDREVLHYPCLGVDVAIIRATTADEFGNLTFEHEAAVVAPYTLAAAAKASRGRVIAQVKRIRRSSEIGPPRCLGSRIHGGRCLGGSESNASHRHHL